MAHPGSVIKMNGNRIRRALRKIYIPVFLMTAATAWKAGAQDIPCVPDLPAKGDTIALLPDTAVVSLSVAGMFTDSIAAEVLPAVETVAAKPPRKRKPVVNIYDMPYSMRANYPNYKNLGINTGVLFCAGVLTLGVLQCLPEGATAWNKDEISKIPFWKRWERNVRHGPVWDKDNFMFNYVLHPYGGAVYYMTARSQGFNVPWSFLYCTFVSNVMWEYGVEAFMEIPSIQDLIVTPVAGMILGEGCYLLKRHIVARGYKLFGSGFLGNFTAYLIDPVNEVVGIFAGNPNRKKYKKPSQAEFTCSPWIGPAANGSVTGFAATLSF